MKPVNQKAWLLILPVVLCVAFSAILPLMTVVNYSVQDIISPERRVFVGTEWFVQIMRDEELHAALLRQITFSLAVLAAVLAVLGYSVNESVVIFDRIRENFRRYRKMSTVEIINNAITSTISRTIITHGSTQIMVLSMLLFGGETLYYFSLALTIGICFGIYSSVFVAEQDADGQCQREIMQRRTTEDQHRGHHHLGAAMGDDGS